MTKLMAFSPAMRASLLDAPHYPPSAILMRLPCPWRASG
jgi:hypothetical protein